MDADELERIAEDVGTYYGFTDRPTCDPRAIATAMGLTLEPWPRARARLDASTVIYSSTARESAQAYFVGHEIGHFLLRGEEPCEGLERACSRIGVALMLPRRAFARDVVASVRLEEAWPLATRKVIRRRIEELRVSSCEQAYCVVDTVDVEPMPWRG